MPSILTIKKYSSENFGARSGNRRKNAAGVRQILNMNCRIARKDIHCGKGSVKIGTTGIIFILAATIIFCGACYLYQVNDLAAKGYEIREIENQIEDLRKSNESYKIKEVELKSMYNIEKSTQDLNLVNSSDVSYLEIKGPVAMK